MTEIEKENLYQYLLLLGDHVMILGHRLSELCGHGPSLETDIALTNISLDLYGQTRSYFQYAASLKDDERTEDSIAFLRYSHEYRNSLLVEQPNTDFAYVIARQFLFDHYHLLLLQQLADSNDETITAIAKKSIKEVSYHTRFSSEWIKRLGDGTEVSKKKIQDAINYLVPYAGELTTPIEIERVAASFGYGYDVSKLQDHYWENIKRVIAEATLDFPESDWAHSGGKSGIHSEHFGYILADLQYMQRAYPDMTW
ncbi:MAG: 1,2-phenylacetyl-CoA epoxidase subunit PaaC [Cyclobacteriaceae bacterium]